jgi:hypothetical protein
MGMAILFLVITFGLQNMNPPLINTSYINGDKAKLVSILLNGMSQQESDT